MTLAPVYADQLAAWAEHGIPDDRSTRDFAVDVVLPKLWAAYRELSATLDAVLADDGQCAGQGALDATDDPRLPLPVEVEG